MKKKLPPAIILGLITLVAALALAATNAVTKGPIFEQGQAAIRAACEAVLPADVYEETSFENAEHVKALYSAKVGGALVGYAAVAEVTGYGGPIEVTVGMDETGTIKGVSVGGINFQETAGLGDKAKAPAFTDQFADKKAPIVLNKGVDAIGGATITSKAVVVGVNAAAVAIGEVAGFTVDLTAAEESAEDTAKEEPVPEAMPEDALTGAAKGFQSDVVAQVALNEDGTVYSVTIDGSGETTGFGTRLTGNPDFAGQFVGKTAPFEIGNGIDALAGATVSSGAAVEAINKAIRSASASDAPLTLLASDIGADALVNGMGQIVIAPKDGFDGAIKLDASYAGGAVTVNDFTAKKVSTATVEGNTASALAKGFCSNVKATVTVDAEGNIVEIKLSTGGETEYLGAEVAGNKAFVDQFIGQTGTLAFGANGLDVVAGATVTSDAVLAAINDCLLGLGVSENIPAPVSTATVEGNTASALAKGFCSNVKATVTVDAEGKIVEIKLSTGGETEYLGAEVAGNKAFVDQFIGQTGTLAFGANGLDVVAGATVTSDAVLAAINDCLLGLSAK